MSVQSLGLDVELDCIGKKLGSVLSGFVTLSKLLSPSHV